MVVTLAQMLRRLADALEGKPPRPLYTRPPVPANSMFKGLKKARFVPWRESPRRGRMHYDPRDLDLIGDYDEEEMFYRDTEF